MTMLNYYLDQSDDDEDNDDDVGLNTHLGSGGTIASCKDNCLQVVAKIVK